MCKSVISISTTVSVHYVTIQDLRVRTLSSIAMLVGFTAVIAVGKQTGCALLVALLQIGTFKVIGYTDIYDI